MSEKNRLYDIHEISDFKDMILKSADMYGDSPAFMVKRGGTAYSRISYNELYSEIRGLATAFSEETGLFGKKYAVVSENRYEWALTYLAVTCGGGIIVPIDKELPFDEILSFIERSGAEVCVCSKKYYDKIKDIPQLKATINMDDGFDAILNRGFDMYSRGNTFFDDVKINPDIMSVLLFTSGTTDIAKGVMLSQKNIVTNIMSMSKQIKIRRDDVFLCLLPLHHTYECTCGFLCPLYLGASIAFCEGLMHIQKNMVESGTSVILGVPAIFENMHKKIFRTAKKQGKLKILKTAMKINSVLGRVGIDASRKLFKDVKDSFGGRLRLMISGAAAIDPKISKDFRNLGISFLQGYGLTECAPIVAVNRDVDFKDEAAGKVIDCMEVKVENEDSDGIGEIVVKGENVMLGYYDNPETTAEVLCDGWFKTGDLGFVDNERFIFITGRKKTVIIASNGKNVFPEELEGKLGAYREIKECLIKGTKNQTNGNTEICAEIYPDYDIFSGSSDEVIMARIETIVKEINDKEPLFKRIRKVHIRKEEFEKTTTRKIKRYSSKNGI